MTRPQHPLRRELGSGELLYELLVHPWAPSRFRVRSFEATEQLSGLYRFDIEVSAASSSADAVEQAALGEPALFIMRVGPAPRVVRGIIAGVRLLGLAGDRARYRFHLAPRLWLLRHRRRSRIFQEARVDEVVSIVLGEAGIDCRWKLEQSYPERAYCTQYEESDYEFICRLAAEYGLYFFYEHHADRALRARADLDGVVSEATGEELAAASAATLDDVFGSETIVLSDGAFAYPPLEEREEPSDSAARTADQDDLPQLHFLSMVGGGASAPTFDKITRIDRQCAVAATRAFHREFDPRRPSNPLEATEDARAAKKASGRQRPPVLRTLRRSSPNASHGLDDLEHYQHHGQYHFPNVDDTDAEPRRLLRALRRAVDVVEGSSYAPGLEPGRRFQLADHPLEHLNQPYAVVSAEHRGTHSPDRDDEEVYYQNEFRCIPADTSYCLPLTEPRKVLSMLTATVIGQTDDGIDATGSGQIRVRFHWDREQHQKPHSSCWIRTMQAWGGASWGSQFIPRVGMEVVVGFEGGDPDKPVVLGSLYNGTHPTPFPLPQDKTRSGLRTQSTPGGDGYNELSFEDQAGEEQIYLRAQRNLDEEVGHDRSVAVAHDDALQVAGNRHERIQRDLALEVGGSQTETVVGQQLSNAGSRAEVTGGDCQQQIGGNLLSSVAMKELREVTGDANIKYAADRSTRVEGNDTTIVGHRGAERSYELHVEGHGQQHATRRLTLSSEAELVLQCGQSSVRLTPDRVEINAPAVALNAPAARLGLSDQGMTLGATGVLARLEEQFFILQNDQGASLSMGKEVKIDAEKILLNSPDRATDELPEDPPPTTTIELFDQAGSPLAGQRYVIHLPDGSQRSGRLDNDGCAEVDLPADGTITFPDLSDVQEG